MKKERTEPTAASSAGRVAQTSDSAGTVTRYLHLDLANPETIVTPPTVRETVRRAAIEKELRLLAGLATGSLESALPVSVEKTFATLSEDALERMQRDARFRLPRAQVRKMLDRFCAEPGPSGKVKPRTLVIVAHQDDETIGVGGQLTRLENATVVHVTNGAPRSVEYAQRLGFDHPDDYSAARQQEAREALRLAGVSDDRVLCLGVQDGEAQHHMVDLSYAIAELIESVKPDVVLTHPYEGGHTDHDAISFAVQLACGVLRREGIAQPAVLELTSYHNRSGQRVVLEFLPFGPRDDVRTFELPQHLRDMKTQMYECFETQRACLAQFPTELERFRPAPRYNYTKPPHAGPLDYERLSKTLSGEDWRKRAHEALERLRTGFNTVVPVSR